MLCILIIVIIVSNYKLARALKWFNKVFLFLFLYLMAICTMLPVFLDCAFLIAPSAASVFSNVYANKIRDRLHTGASQEKRKEASPIL